MNYFAIGEIIREFRTRANIKQAQLCEGLCEPSYTLQNKKRQAKSKQKTP